MKIFSYGGAREVGGSCYVIETKDNKIALDYGIRISEGLSKDMPKKLDAIAISHAHLDHSGNLLTMANRNIVILGSQATRDVTCELLKDLIKIHRMSSKHIPYNSHDVNKIKNLWLPKKRVALPGIEVALHPAGHVLGASMIQITSKRQKVLYTGDFCLHDTEILDGAKLNTLPSECDALIMESTYGGVVRENRDELIKKLFNLIDEAINRKGNVLIPTFAFHRYQEMTQRIDQAMKNKRIPRYNAYCISGLAHRITKYFTDYKSLLSNQIKKKKKPFNLSKVKQIRRTKDIKEPAIVICTSGFGHAGASRALLYDWANNESNFVIINSGFLPPNSPLKIAKEKGIIESNGKSKPVKANIKQVQLSGHADQANLIKFVKILKPKKTYLIHGNLDQAQALSEKISRYTNVNIPENGQTLEI